MPAGNVTVAARYSQKLATPYTDSAKTLVRYNAPYLEFDRGTGTMLFAPAGIGYVLIHIYAGDESAEALGTIIFRRLDNLGASGTGAITTMDGKYSVPLLGMINDVFINPPSQNTAFWTIVKLTLGFNYNEANTYYFAAQRIGQQAPIEDTYYLDSDVSSARSALCEVPGTVTSYNFEVLNGAVAGTEQTSGTVGKGAMLVISPVVPEGKYFAGWYEFTYDGNNEPVLGAFVSGSNVLNITASKDLKLIAKSADEEASLKLAPLPNDTNQVFNWFGTSGVSAGAAEFVRYGNPSPFSTDGADYLIIYVYDSQTADKDAYVGRFKVLAGAAGEKIESIDGLISATYDGGPTNACIQGANITGKFYPLMLYCISTYSSTQDYYFAVQVKAKSGTMYADSDISDIGTAVYNEEGTKVRA
jgi:hypothetical protein